MGHRVAWRLASGLSYMSFLLSAMPNARATKVARSAMAPRRLRRGPSAGPPPPTSRPALRQPLLHLYAGGRRALDLDLLERGLVPPAERVHAGGRRALDLDLV